MESVLIAAAVLAVILFAIGWYYSGIAFLPRVISHEDAYRHEIEAGRIVPEEVEKLPHREIMIPSPFGYTVYGQFFPVPGSTKTAILCHGYTYNLYGSIKFLNLFLDRGFNVLLVDHRYHGRSGGRYTTFGYYEKVDLKACVDWVLSNVGENSLIGTHGESLGAGVVLQHAAIDPRIAFAIADSGYSDLERLLKLRLREDFRLPVFPILPLAVLVGRLRCGIEVSRVSPIGMLIEVKTPILFIHGENDTLIPCQMSMEMYEQYPERRRLYLVPGARHAETYWVDKAAYNQHLDAFLEEFRITAPPVYTEPG